MKEDNMLTCLLVAISTLLQPPIVRTGLLPHTSAPISSAHRPPTARDIPPVALTNIPHVDPSEFKPYLSQVGALYEALQKAKENEEDEALRVIRRGSKEDEFANLLAGDNKGRAGMSRNGSLASLGSLTPSESPPRRRSSGGPGKRATQATAPLSTIPSVYFEDDFHLENRRTFDIVSERSEVVRPAPGAQEERKNSNGDVVGPRKALATNAILQEKLSWYMDTIEVHLISSISTASTSFFAALGSLRELHSEAAGSVARIRQLREELQALDNEMVVGGLEIVNKRRKRENLKQLGDAINQLKCIVEGVRHCESLADEGEVEKALDAIDSLENLISGEQTGADAIILDSQRQHNLRDLRGATALQGVDNDLDTLRYGIGKTFETRFLDALLSDLRQHIEVAPVADVLKRWNIASVRARGGHNREKSAFPTYMNLNDEFRAELLSNLHGLHRSRYTSAATSAYHDAVLREIKAIIKRPLPSSNDDDADSVMSMATTQSGSRQRSQQDRASILARNLRNLDAVSAEETLVKIYIGVGETLRRLGTQVKVLLDVTTTMGEPSPLSGPRSPPRNSTIGSIEGRARSDSRSKPSSREIQEELHQALDMSNLLGQAVDIAQNQIVKILRVRTEQSTHQSATRFLRYFTLNLLFANECENVSGRSGTILKTLVNGQIREFIQHMSDSQQQDLAQGMGSDLWNAKDFDEEDSLHLAKVLEASDHDPEVWSAASKVWLPYDDRNDSRTANGDVSLQNAQTNKDIKDKTRSATIESESFILPSSAILCLRGLGPYLQLITVIPAVTSEISAALISYLQLFNSRCTQLILGAGATRSVGLKNITTKHLALAHQALSFIATLIPYIREFVRRHAGSGPQASSLMGEFDKVRRLYQEHQQNISDKLVDIMAGRATLHINAMKKIQWDKAPSKVVSPYMETLTKETTTLHKVLSRHLPEPTVLMIMDPVFRSYREQWGKAFEDAVVETEEGKQRYICNPRRPISYLNQA
jgi:vacuolar protein sorting-associated protein 54